jgi:hypothetical protein
MGSVDAHHRRLTAAFILLIIVASLAVLASLGASRAQAQSTFEPTCVACHTEATVHPAGYPSAGPSANPNHAGIGCGTCHTNGTASPPPTSACGGCHGGVATILTKPTHTTQGCGTTVGCHGYTSPTPTPTPSATAAKTTMTLKVSPTTVRVRKTVKFAGTAGPVAALAGAKVAFKVERKVGTKWVKMKAATKVVSATGKFAWSYKTAKKGTHRVTASIAKKTTYTAKKLVKSFKVK